MIICGICFLKPSFGSTPSAKTSHLTIEELNLTLDSLIKGDLELSDSLIQGLEKRSSELKCSSCIIKSHYLQGRLLFNNQEFDKALRHFRIVQHLNDSLGSGLLTHKNALLIGRVYERMGLVDQAIPILQKEKEYALNAGDSSLFTNILLILSGAQRRSQKHDQALSSILEISNFIGPDTKNPLLPEVYNQIGIIYLMMNKKELSRDYFFKALENNDLSTNTDQQKISIYSNLSNLYLKRFFNTDSAIYYGRRAVIQSEESGKPSIGAMINLGNVFEEISQRDSALFYYKKAENTPELDFLHMERAAVQINIGYINSLLERYKEAEDYLQKGIAAARLSGSMDFEEIAQRTLFYLDSVQGNYLDAIGHQNEIIRLKDSLFDRRMYDKVNELSIAHETNLLASERDGLLKQKSLNERIIRNQNFVVLLTGLVSLLLMAFLVVIQTHRKKLRQLNKNLQDNNKKLREQKIKLEELNSTKDKFFSIIAHDLRSPFNVLNGYLDLLDREFDDFTEEEKKDIIRELKSASKNTFDLLENLLEWARSQRGLIENQPKNIDLHEIAATAIKILNGRALLKNQEINLKTEKGEHIAFADWHMTQNLFINLINNSIKFSPKKGEIEVNCEKSGDFIKVSIKDNGIGIPKEKQEDLFSIKNPFKTLGTEKEKGTGLGLIMSKEFVEIMNGRIDFNSTEGEGSTFNFYLPIAKS